MHRRVVAGIAGILVCAWSLSSAAGDRVVSAEDWVAAGDAAMDGDPGRALADYQEAKAATAKGAVPPPSLEAKTSAAAAAWLRREAAALRSSDRPHALGTLAAIRAEAARRGVHDQIAGDLADAERAVAANVWSAQKSAVESAADPFEAYALATALENALPASAKEVGPEIAATRERRVAESKEKIRALHAGSGAHAGARLVRARMLEALGVSASGSTEDAARAARISWSVTATGCESFRRVALPPSSGAHVGQLRITGSCSVGDETVQKERTDTVYDEKRTPTTRTERHCVDRSVFVPQCRCSTYSKNDGSGFSKCISWETCHQKKTECTEERVPSEEVTRTPRKVIVPYRVRQVRASISAEIQTDIDGQVLSRGFSDSARSEESSEDTRSFGRGSPATLLEGLARKLDGAAEAEARVRQQGIAAEHAARGARAAAEGALDAAEDDVIAARLAGDASAVSDAHVQLARSTYGIPGPAYARFLAARPAPLAFADFGRASAIAPPAPDASLQNRDRAHASAVRETRETWEGIEKTNGTRFNGAFALQQAQSGAPDRPLTHGFSGAIRLSMRGGRTLFGLAELETGVGYDPAASGWNTDSSLLLGLGLRTSRIGVAVGPIAGLLGRATEDAARYLYVPFGADLGGAARADLRVTQHAYVSLIGAQMLRLVSSPDATGAALEQHVRYALRFAYRGAEKDRDVGLELACIFHQDRTGDVLFPTAAVRGRMCSLALVL